MSRPRDKASSAGLLPRMEARVWADGKTVTYRYLPLGGKWMNLGTDRTVAMRRVLDMNGQTDIYGSLRWVWERYTDEEKPAKRWVRLTEGSKGDYRTAWKQLDAVFAGLGYATMAIAAFLLPETRGKALSA